MTLDDGTTTLTLRADLQYTDRFEVERSRSEHYVFGGAVVIQESSVIGINDASGKRALIVGQPITLQATASYAWLTLAQAHQLNTWALTEGVKLTLADLRDLPDLTVAIRRLNLSVIQPDADNRIGPYYAGEIGLTVTGVP